MNCSQCGHEAVEGANACTNCGASLAVGAPAAPPGSFAAPPGAGVAPPAGTVAHAGSAEQFSFDLNRLSTPEKVAGVASFLVLVSLFLPWLSGSSTVTVAGVTSRSNYGSISGYTLHGYFWLVFVLSLVVVGFLVLKAGFTRFPVQLPLSDDQIILGLTGVVFVLVLLGFLFTGYGFARGGGVVAPGYSYHYGTSRSFGAYLSLVLAIVAVAPFAWPFIQQQRNKGSATAS
jgi:hypothetical protein